MIDLHADDNGTPGNHLASMIMPDDFAQDNFTPADLTATVAPRHTNLNPGTRYWIVITNEQEFNTPPHQRDRIQSARFHFPRRLGDRQPKSKGTARQLLGNPPRPPPDGSAGLRPVHQDR